MDNAENHDETASSNGLFSMSATDNAEVVKPGVQRGADGLWTVSAKPTSSTVSAEPSSNEGDSDAVDGEVVWDEDSDNEDSDSSDRSDPKPDDDDVDQGGHEVIDDVLTGDWQDSGSDDDIPVEGEIWGINDGFSNGSDDSADDHDGTDGADAADDHVDSDGPSEGSSRFRNSGANFDSVGSVFSAEPVDRGDDVVDEPDTDDDEFYSGVGESASSLFSSGGRFGSAGGAKFAGTGAPYFTPAGGTGPSSGLWEATDDPSHAEPTNRDPLRSEPLWDASEGSYGAQGTDDAGDLSRREPQSFGDEDSPGYEAAILKLHPQDRERASVALSVAGALLNEGEEVLGVVTGQMLGRQAAVVVTAGRVLVVNDRRWQPVVDRYTIDQKLRVRGRHDRNIAALSFSDEWSLSMVDGITEVSIAMDLAERIRQIADDQT